MCVFPEGCETCSGETDGSGTVVDNDADNDGVCNDDEILGCTNPEACNYVEEATDDDGSCDLLRALSQVAGFVNNTATPINHPDWRTTRFLRI